MAMWHKLLDGLQQQDRKSLARTISLIENEVLGYDDFLQKLPSGNTPIIGVTGPPGAGKSSIIDALIGNIVAHQQKVAVLCVDPSSAFSRGALLGDRIRMNVWYKHPDVYIRSLASRGSLGGLTSSILEVSSVLQVAGFDYIIIETVGVGQSEIEIVGLADITVVVLVPEAGDEIQTMKAGLMEIADIFVMNKSDRPDAAAFLKNLLALKNSYAVGKDIAVVSTVAIQEKGITQLYDEINTRLDTPQINDKKLWLLTNRLYQIIQKKKMQSFDKNLMMEKVKQSLHENNVNLYQLASEWAG